MPADELPEGTDAIVNGAGVDAHDEELAQDMDEAEEPEPASEASSAKSELDAAAQSFASRIEGLKGQANDRARAFVEEAKARTVDSIEDVVRLIHEAADEVDGKIGSNYGDYVRRAADGIAALSDGLRQKDVDGIFADARGLVGRAPGVAIGAAAAIGFVAARLARAGIAGTAGVGQPEREVA